MRKNKKIIGIIGSGMIGKHVAQLAVNAGIDVVICNSRGPETLTDIINELGEKVEATTIEGVASAADLIVLAIPFKGYKSIPASVLAGKIVIDTLNYYPERDGVMSEVKTDQVTTSQMLQAHLSQSIVIRALNNLDYIRLLTSARPKGAVDRSTLPIGGDDKAAKIIVKDFLDAIGYDSYDFGALSESWKSEPTSPIYVIPYMDPKASYVGSKVTFETFATAPGRVVNQEEAEKLIKSAVRHDKMFGKLPVFLKSEDN